MIHYIIAAGIGAFLGSQSKKSKKSYAKGGEVLVVKTKKGLKTMKDFEDFSKDEIKEWGTERGLKYNAKGEKFGGQALKVDEFFVKPRSRYNVKLPSSTYAEGGKTDEYVAITLKPKKSAYRGGKGEVYKSMQNFYDTINTTDNKDKYEFIHSIFISDSRKSDPKDISEIKVYMIGEKSGFDDVEKRGLYDFFDLVKTKEEVKDYAKGGSIKRFDTMVYWEDEDGQSGEKEYRGVIADSEEKAERHVRAMLEEDFDEMEVYEPYITHVSIEER